MLEKAIAEHDRESSIQRGNSQLYAARKAAIEDALKISGARGYWQKMLEFAMDENPPNSWLMAKFHLRLGERDKAWEFLEKLYSGRSAVLVWLKVSPEFDNIRSDPRFADLMRRVGIPQ